MTSETSDCLAKDSLSRPLDAEDAELTPLVVERVDIVEAALDPTPFSLPELANGRREFLISASAF